MPEQSQPGRLVGGRYRLVDRLGAGGMGRVWRAHDETLGIDVAIKEVALPFTLSDAQLRERLSRAEREARNTARLRDQPGIVTVHDVVIDDDAPWIVMQLVAGRSLAEHLREHGPLSVGNAAKVADTMLRALAAAHAAGIVHRDVKPANVLLADDGRVLLTDFGIAQHQDDSSLTATGAVIGSAEYLAPERARAGDAGPPSDLFSLGVTLYQALEGVSPFRRDTPTATMTAVLFEQPAPPRNAGRLAPLLAWLLAKDPGRRPSVTEALAMVSGGGGAATTTPTPAAPSTRELTNGAGRTRQPASQSPYATAPRRGNGLKIGLTVAGVVVVSVLTTLAITQLTHSGSPSAGPTTSSSSKTTPPTGTPATTLESSSAIASSQDSIIASSQDSTTDSTSPISSGAKAGCAEASRDLNAFNASNPAAHGGKDFQITADRNLASELSADAALATDPAVQAAIQSEADSWNKFADYYANSDTTGMSNTIPQTTKAIAAVNTACRG